jgi:hypothetical protein
VTGKKEIQNITSQACAIFSDHLVQSGCKSNVLIIVAPVNCARDVTAAANTFDLTAKLIARKFMNSRNNYTRQLVQELPPTRPIVPQLPSRTDIRPQYDDQTVIVCAPDNHPSLALHASKPPVDLSEMAAQACEQIIDLFENNGMEMDCFIAIASLKFDLFSNDAVTAASTARSTSTNDMLHSFIASSQHSYTPATTNHVMYLEEPDEYDE